jgi:hypothetical protein
VAEPDSKAARRAARERVGRYHEAQLQKLLEHVRDGVSGYEGGELDAFELDGILHQYTRAARELWKFCSVTGVQALYAARTLDAWAQDGEEEPDWWGSGAPRRPR